MQVCNVVGVPGVPPFVESVELLGNLGERLRS